MHDWVHRPRALQPGHTHTRSGRLGDMQGLPGWRVPGRRRCNGVYAVWWRQLLPCGLVSPAALTAPMLAERAAKKFVVDATEPVASGMDAAATSATNGLVLLDCLAGPHALLAGHGRTQSEERELH